MCESGPAAILGLREQQNDTLQAADILSGLTAAAAPRALGRAPTRPLLRLAPRGHVARSYETE